MKPVRHLLRSLPPGFLLLIVFIQNALGQTQIRQKITSNQFDVGYTIYKLTDTSRLYKPHTNTSSPLHFRPVELDLWYPATISNGEQVLPYRYFVSLFEKRANSFQDSTSYTGLTDELMRHFTVADGKASTIQLPTKSVLNAVAIPGKFPLVVYLCSYNGMSYENVPLFETLASHGYVVVAITSVGRYPGNMTTKYPDVLEQVKDAELAMHVLKDKNADVIRIGLIGYSYGGVAAAITGMRNKSVKAVLSLDGSETHYYGRDPGEDQDFDALRQTGYFNSATLRQDYAYIESDHKNDEGAADSVYRLGAALMQTVPHPYLRLNGAEHEDFSCVSDLAERDNSTYSSVKQLALAFADQYISGADKAYDTTMSSLLTEKKGSTAMPVLAPKIDSTIRVTLKGRIVGEKDSAALPYVSIGIPEKDCGTVSDNGGNFTLVVSAGMLNDTLRISSLGYQPQVFKVNQLAAMLKGKPVIILRQQETALKEVFISAKKPHLKTVGNTSTSKFFNVGFPLRDLGSEVGIKISLGHKTVRLRSFNFNISNVRLDTGTFRLNIYSIKKGLPDQNLLTRNILVGISNKPGAYSIDLAPFHLDFKGDIFVSLEWIQGKTSGDHGVVFFSAGLLSSSYHRKTTEAGWVAFKGLGAAFNLKIEDLE